MTSEERLGALYAAIRALGFPALVMGGHAARFYGIDRTTIDYDLHVIVDDAAWNRFGDELQRSPLFTSAPFVEGPSWEPVEAAVAAAKPREPTGEPATLQKVPERLLNESRQAFSVAQTRGLRAEGLEMIAQCAARGDERDDNRHRRAPGQRLGLCVSGRDPDPA